MNWTLNTKIHKKKILKVRKRFEVSQQQRNLSFVHRTFCWFVWQKWVSIKGTNIPIYFYFFNWNNKKYCFFFSLAAVEISCAMVLWPNAYLTFLFCSKMLKWLTLLLVVVVKLIWEIWLNYRNCIDCCDVYHHRLSANINKFCAFSDFRTRFNLIVQLPPPSIRNLWFEVFDVSKSRMAFGLKQESSWHKCIPKRNCKARLHSHSVCALNVTHRIVYVCPSINRSQCTCVYAWFEWKSIRIVWKFAIISV